MILSQADKFAADPRRQIDEYIETHSEAEPDYLKHVVRETVLQVVNPRMMSGHLQGRLLKILVEISGAEKILEIGTFSGYSALCLAEGLPENGIVDSIEINDEMETFIRSQLNTNECGKKVNLLIGNALDIIPSLDKVYDMVFIYADKRLYQTYYDMVLPKLKKGGIILADNTLWDGKVLIDTPNHNDTQTIAIKAFNDFVAQDIRVEKIILPLRDGLTLIRKK